MNAATALSALALFVLFPFASHYAVHHGWSAAWIFYVLPVLIDLALFGLFAATLRAGHEPLISRFARRERGVLTPELVTYTRLLTQIWSVFFLVMAALAASLALWAPFMLWSLFTSAVSYLLIAALFLGEYVYRLQRFPHYRHASPWQLLRNLQRSGLRRDSDSRPLR